MLTANNLSKSFGAHQVLRDISVTIAPGTITTVIGPSGTGKTTLLRALAMTDVADRGEITMDGKNYKFPWPENEKLSPKPWTHITAVFQQLFLWPHLTLRENILLPARNFLRATMMDELQELISVLELAGFIDRFPNEASLGQRQRIALARALMLQPRYVLMDEVTSALDIEQVSNILGFLPRLKERGIGVLIITHALNFARRAADHILFMDQGKMIEHGNARLLDNPQTPRLKQFLSMVEAAH
ncbi:MAG TPA: ATP-binding cassette domain-containing protein [Alphaproteobacteria bacterium]|nr:ATP-binding cassette domain-containing protein [Alphaproteobacteria bacterium]